MGSAPTGPARLHHPRVIGGCARAPPTRQARRVIAHGRRVRRLTPAPTWVQPACGWPGAFLTTVVPLASHPSDVAPSWAKHIQGVAYAHGCWFITQADRMWRSLWIST
jgi:hypothetical protein